MLKKVNVVYELDYEDVDILYIPSDMADDIDGVAQDFFCWLGIPENRRRFLVKEDDGSEVLYIGTKEFIWWLNHIKITDGPKAKILMQHTSYDPQYPAAYF